MGISLFLESITTAASVGMGCGHNCSLANPRCMRGARKQSSAKSEYSELYG